MKLEFKESSNPVTKEGVRALAIVLGVILVISAVVYAANFGKRKESTIVPAKTLEEVTVTPQPTVTSLTKEATLSASPSSTRKVQIKEATVSPTIR